MKLKYTAQPQKILELIHYKVTRAEEVLEKGKIYDIPQHLVDRCMETGFFEKVEEKAPKKVEKVEKEKD